MYVHVPVCRSKCAYCDFYSVRADAIDTGPEAVALHLLQQARTWRDRGATVKALQSLYVGGGTPTMLGSALAFLVEALGGIFGFAGDAEVTIEANPDSLEGDLVRMLRHAGVTRVSLGVQSLVDDELRALGRRHSAAEALAAAGAVLDAGLDLSVDLMCGIPRQTRASWEGTVGAAIALGCDHVSVYPLTIEEGTPLERAVFGSGLRLPDEDYVAAMMEAASGLLESAGLQRYEVASFARRGHESVHNSAYWTGREYLGIGPSAHGMLDVATARSLGLGTFGPRVGRVRYSIVADLWEGLEAAPPLDLELLSGSDALREDAMLGLRLKQGISDSLAVAAGVVDVLEALRDDGLVEHAGDSWRTTARGWLLGNEVFGRVWGADAAT